MSSVAAKPNHATIKQALAEAREAALAADPGPGADGGACNFDSPAIYLPGMQERTVKRLASEAGVDVIGFRWLGGRRWWWVMVPLCGQADRRTTMAQAACHVLEAHGLEAMMYMQMD